jgi:hypothetical protein
LCTADSLVCEAAKRALRIETLEGLINMKKSVQSRKYGKKASAKVGRAMHEMKKGKLKSGRSGKKVKSRKQAVAIGLSEARKAGAKVPPR